jgi:hypothetical protein
MRNPCAVTNRLRISYRCTMVALEDFTSIVAGRHVTERRQVIGILRSTGYRRQDVLVGLLVEPAALTPAGWPYGEIELVAVEAWQSTASPGAEPEERPVAGEQVQDLPVTSESDHTGRWKPNSADGGFTSPVTTHRSEEAKGGRLEIGDGLPRHRIRPYILSGTSAAQKRQLPTAAFGLPHNNRHVLLREKVVRAISSADRSRRTLPTWHLRTM